ncbi:hypothetical protein V6N13_092964 [Hibiscus sabdariffa]
MKSVVCERGKRPNSNSMPKMKHKKKKKKTKIDAKMPKKPPTAFFYFLEDFRTGFQEQNPDIRSMCDVCYGVSEVGSTSRDNVAKNVSAEKVKYYDIATEKQAEFDRAMAEFIKRKESGEDEETEDDSDFDE